MDGTLWGVIGTVITVVAANTGLYYGLGDKIDKVRKDVSNNAAKIAELETKDSDSTRFCDERHRSINERLQRLENYQNNKNITND